MHPLFSTKKSAKGKGAGGSFLQAESVSKNMIEVIKFNPFKEIILQTSFHQSNDLLRHIYQLPIGRNEYQRQYFYNVIRRT